VSREFLDLQDLGYVQQTGSRHRSGKGPKFEAQFELTDRGLRHLDKHEEFERSELGMKLDEYYMALVDEMALLDELPPTDSLKDLPK
jgi:hypothetical protein